jgi:hypothetical protein
MFLLRGVEHHMFDILLEAFLFIKAEIPLVDGL